MLFAFLWRVRILWPPSAKIPIEPVHSALSGTLPLTVLREIVAELGGKDPFANLVGLRVRVAVRRSRLRNPALSAGIAAANALAAARHGWLDALQPWAAELTNKATLGPLRLVNVALIFTLIAVVARRERWKVPVSSPPSPI